MAGMEPGKASANGDLVQFQALITPHRSLSLTGLRVLLGAVLLSCVVSAGVFAAVGAWPVGVFAGAELLLAAWLFHLHMRAARASELLLLSAEGLRVVRTSADGVVTAHLLPVDWMTVRLEERPGRVPALLLLGHGRREAIGRKAIGREAIGREEIGQELGAEAKISLAEALADALHRRRHPKFDNPQLR